MEADLVLEGGGVKGIALAGAYSVLKEAGYGFRRVAGSSAGSLVGALIAADVPPEHLAELIRAVDFRSFRVKLTARPESGQRQRFQIHGTYDFARALLGTVIYLDRWGLSDTR
jgi:predicted acylesterase/phospholipase RssA